MQNLSLVWFLDSQGGFTVGDRISGATNYAYPTSDWATLAKRFPLRAAASAIAVALTDGTRYPQSIIEPYNARNWERLNSQSLAETA